MNWILKNKNRSVLIGLLSSLARKWKQLFISLVSFDNKKAKAIVAALFLASFLLLEFPNVWESKTALAAACKTNPECGDPAFPSCNVKTGSCDTEANVQASYADTAPSAPAPAVKAAQNVESGIFVTAFKQILVGVFNATAWLFSIAATLFAWVVEPKNISGEFGVLNEPAIKDVWIMVRDLLNMTFILVLLFAAFCTIFQVDRWNLKKVWLNILINALLVNFSYPIARFFIDVSNVAFYYFINTLFSSTGTVTGSSIFASFGSASNLGAIVGPDGYAKFDVAYLISMIVFTFILGMTLLIIAALFIVRLVALAMIVMFSPIGFVGYILPSTAGYANKWWEALFSYSFFAPIMIFIMAISLRIIEALGRENFQAFLAGASANSPADQSIWIANATFFTIPIIILWMGIGLAKSSGGALASEIVGNAKKGGKWLASSPGALGGYAWKKSGVPGGIKKGMDDAKKSGKLFGSTKLGWFAKDGTAGREAGIASVIGKEKGESFKAAYNKAGKKSRNNELDEDVKKAIENHDTETTTALRTVLESTSPLYREATDAVNKDRKKGVEYMSKYKQLMSDPIRKQEYEANIRNTVMSAPMPVHIAGMRGSSQKAAALEAHVQNEIATNYGALKTNYQEVKKNHKEA